MRALTFCSTNGISKNLEGIPSKTFPFSKILEGLPSDPHFLPVPLGERKFWDIFAICWHKCVAGKCSRSLTLFVYLCSPLQYSCLRACGHIAHSYIYDCKVFYCFMSCGKSATVSFQGRLESLLQDMVCVFGSLDAFSFSYGNWENWGLFFLVF